MQKTFFKKLAVISILSYFCISAAYAASTPPLSIIGQETAQNMQTGGTQVLTFTIKNNVPVAPVQLNMQPNRTMLSPASEFTTSSITTTCSYNGMQDYVPPNGTCNINVTITAGTSTGHVTQSLLINYGPTFQIIAPAPVLSFDVNGSSGGTFVFTVQPTGHDMLVGGTQNLRWTVRNTTTSDISINNSTINFTESSQLIETPTFTNTCQSVVPANGGTCNIDTTITAKNTAGTVSQYLAIPYNSGSTLVADSPTNFDITAVAATLSYTAQPTSPQVLTSGGQTNLIYTIHNNSSTTPVLYTASPTSSNTNLVIANVSDPCGGTIAQSGTCTITVGVQAGNVTSIQTAAVNFTVQYGEQPPLTSSLPANPINFTINPTPGGDVLTFVQPLPIAPNLPPSTTGAVMQYFVSNSSGVAVPFTATVSPQTYATAVVANQCSGSVPANGTCEVDVTLTSAALTNSQLVSQALTINYATTKNLVANFEYTITVTSSPDLTFSSLPSPSTVSLPVNTAPTTASFVYTIANSSSSAIPFQASAAPSTSANDAISFTNTCGGLVPASGSCDLNVFVATTNQPIGSPGIEHALSVYFGDNYQYRIQQQPTFNVVVTPSSQLAFTQAPAANNAIIDGATQTLKFIVRNNDSVSHTVTGVSIATQTPPSTGKDLAVIAYTPLGSDSPCQGATAILAPTATCAFVVNISAPSSPVGTSAPGSITQNLVVTSTANTLTNVLLYNVFQSPLSFLVEPNPQTMAVGETQTLTYGIHNADSVNAVAFNSVSLAQFPNGPAPVGQSLFTPTFTNNCNGLVPPNGNCVITMSVAGTTTGSVANLGLFIANNSSTLLRSTFPINFFIGTTATPKRTLTFVNNCPSGNTMWIGLNGGASNNNSSTGGPPNPHIAGGTGSTCNSNSDCPNGASCVTTNIQTATKLCFWNNLGPVGGFALAPGASTTAPMYYYSQPVSNNKNVVWSGNITARTSCANPGLCTTGDCTGASPAITVGVNQPNSQGACFPGIGATPPAALAEFTFSRTSPDFYDVSIINGANVPISMVPNNLTAYQTTQHGQNGYICGDAGSASATSNGAGAASWAFTPPTDIGAPASTQFVTVSYISGAAGCSLPGTPCTTPGQVCGLALNPTGSTFNQQCGVFLGYWTGDQICGTNDGVGSVGFNCTGNAGMSGQFAAATIANLYKCDIGIPSCYQASNTNNQCCGCSDWWEVPDTASLVPAAQVEACPAASKTPAASPWNNVIQFGGSGRGTPSTPNNLAWLKAAVPSAYTYPFDDPSSTFTCPNCSGGGPAGTGCSAPVPASEFNVSDYTITFCPGGTLIPTPPA